MDLENYIIVQIIVNAAFIIAWIAGCGNGYD